MMKQILLFFACLSLMACGTSTKSNEEDSTGSDSLAIFKPDDVETIPADASDIKASVDLLVQQAPPPNSHYTLQLVSSGYEYRTDETWTFDSLLNLAYCHQDWSSEGSEGASHHFFRRDRLYATWEETEYADSKDVNIYHLELGGISYSETASPADTVAKPLDRNFLDSSEKDLKSQLAKIVVLLKENRSDITEGDPAELHIENNSEDKELPGTETTGIVIDRKLLNELLK